MKHKKMPMTLKKATDGSIYHLPVVVKQRILCWFTHPLLNEGKRIKDNIRSNIPSHFGLDYYGHHILDCLLDAGVISERDLWMHGHQRVIRWAVSILDHEV